jgi:hypothetical protein
VRKVNRLSLIVLSSLILIFQRKRDFECVTLIHGDLNNFPIS